MIPFLLLQPITSSAQETLIYSEYNVHYRRGLELFHHDRFGAAQEEFSQAINEINRNGETNDHLLLINAHYYKALCSKNLSKPDAEKLFVDLVEHFEESPVTRLSYFHLGDIYFDKKKYDKAISWYKLTDRDDLNPAQNADYAFQLGFSYFYKKDFDKAQPLFEEVRKQEGKNYYPANYYYGYISYKKGNYSEALKSFKQVEKSSLYMAIVPYYVANIYYQQRKYDEVITYASALAENKLQYSLEMQELIGKAYFQKKQYDKALPYFTAFMSGKSKLSKSDLYQIGYCQYQVKNYNEAISSFKELNGLKDSIGQNSMYLLADCYLKTGQKNDARMAFEEASKLSFDPFVKEHAEFQFAKLSFDLDYHDITVKAFQYFIITYPESDFIYEAKEYLGLELLATQNYKNAWDILRSIPEKNLQIRTACQKVAYSYATELYNLKNYDDAVIIFNESLKYPLDAGIQAACYFWIGESFFQQKKYDDAIKSLSLFIDLSNQQPQLPYNISEVNADYTMAYSFLKKDDYNKASDFFETVLKKVASSKDPDHKKLYADASLRNGDCQFVSKNYGAAINNYDQVISLKYPGADYGLYQKAIIYGLQNDITDKLTTLKNLTTGFPSSIYLDDALYELGITYLLVPSYQEAASVFTQIISKYPNSSYISRAHLKMGLIYFNLNDDTKALGEYEWVLLRYPKTAEGIEALNGAKEIYTQSGDAQGYLSFVKRIPNITVSDAVKDSVMYLAAETKYIKSDCSGAVKEFSNYISSFPAGNFALHAHFYRGECLFRQNDFDLALKDYEFVADEPQSRFTEKALVNAARINYVQRKDYAKAFRYYKIIYENAEFKSNSLEALKGMMNSAYYLNQYDDAANAARQILISDNSTSDDLNEAHFYLAKIAVSTNDLSQSFSEFALVANQKSVIGAESAYMLADIYFKQKNFKAAEEQAYVVIKQKPSFNYWIARSYLLIAAIFEEEGDYFQSKATLQSIIDNYKGVDEIVATAKEKLASVSAMEATDSKLLPEGNNEEMVLDSISNND